MTDLPSADHQALLSIRDLRVNFGDTEVVHGVDLEVKAGERVAIVGQSGSGKSTVMSAILRLLPGSGHITGGSIVMDGFDLTQADDRAMRDVRGNRIGLVPQDPATNLNPSMKVGAQIGDALKAHGLRDRVSRKRRTIELMDEAGIPEPERRAGQFPHEFSGGMRQRILIAIALAREPQLIIADEPTSALDVTVQARILDHLQTLVDDHGTSLLFITHDLGVAADRTDRVAVMLDGRVVENGDPQEILRNPQHEYTRKLIAAAPSVSATEGVARVTARSQGVEKRGALEPILLVQDVVKDYKLRGQRGQTIRAVDHVSFKVQRGATTAVVGESGSGKSTLAKIALGLEQPSAGKVLINGRAFNDRAARKELRRCVQPVFQDPYGSLNPTFTIERLIDEPLRIFRMGDRTSRRTRVADLLDQVALPRNIAQRRAGELSGGQRQRVAIARALALDSELVILDEAVSALDVLVQHQILKLLRDLQEQLGLSYLFITHDLAVVRELAHHVVVMRRGQVVEEGGVEEVFTVPQHEYTTGLLDAIPGASLTAS
ncbi:dipeptide ABC transporter ATP-binding protein [Nesterenkonia muleiensis]|uniref:dipeptide ABC transporter ATP-binding protein n=1 Tax=Nesterenkonia muleiensis TaxID=2282648 RepID=UPI000E745E58|nr:ABC transporter ATP-binding protein [Nesterenkonia muleiensis]